ncbi:MAG: GerW family sporulation protein [Lachnospiraceae bacterium]|nr:GerW family sporulation protein [Lachnospiraceae bacterium]
MSDNNFKNTVEELFKGMDSFMTSKTVVGEPIHIGETIILPLVDVSFAVGAGAGQTSEKNPGAGGGMGGKMSPSAVLVINNGTTKLVNVKNQDSVTKILDMVPDFVNKFTADRKPASDVAGAAAGATDADKKADEEA